MALGDQIRAAPFSGVNQTSFMFGAILFAFLFFVTVRGDLSSWLGLLGLGATSTASTTPALPDAQNPTGGLPALPTIPAITGTGIGAGGLT